MKISLALSSLLFALAGAATLPAAAVDSRIAAVTVYVDRAVVTRTATVAVGAPGPVELVFDRLPAALIDQSVQVTGRGSAAAALLDVTTRPMYLETAASERVKALETQLQALARDERGLTDRGAVLAQQREYVTRIEAATTAPAKDVAVAATPLDTWTRLLAFSADQRQRIATELQAIDTQREELQARRTALEQQLNELRGQEGRSFKSVVVRLNAASNGSLDVVLRYAVFGASWVPAYDARVNAGEHAVQLGYFGLVRQNTGEDWTHIDLTLSTARPSLGGAAPELPPWVVQQREIGLLRDEATSLRPVAQFNATAMRKATAAPARAGGLAANEPEIAAPDAAVEAQATSATFRLPAPADVPADNAAHRVSVTALPLKAEFSHTATPKLLPAAFLTAAVTNSSDYPLLTGSLNVFLDDTFVATSSLRTVMPGEKFDLALGADEAIAVQRKLNNRLVEDTGLVTKSRRLTYDVTLTVQNNRKTEEKVLVQDQLPVSRHEKIVVRQLAPEPRDVKPDAAGVLKWTLTLKPGEKRELPLKFSIEHPVDLPVSGLD